MLVGTSRTTEAEMLPDGVSASNTELSRDMCGSQLFHVETKLRKTAVSKLPLIQATQHAAYTF